MSKCQAGNKYDGYCRPITRLILQTCQSINIVTIVIQIHVQLQIYDRWIRNIVTLSVRWGRALQPALSISMQS